MASSRSWPIALSRLPAGSPAETWVRSEGRRSCKPHQLAAKVIPRLAVADLGQLVAVVEAALQVRLLQSVAQDRALDAPHDRHGAVEGGDVVVGLDDLVAHHQPGHEQQQHQRRRDDDAAPGAWLGRRFRFGDNTFGDGASRVDRRGAAGGGVGRRHILVVAGDGAGQDGLRLAAVVVVDDIGDDHGDVVGAATTQRQFDQPVRAFGDIRDLQRLEDGLVADRIGQPVRAQQVAVAFAGLAHDQRRLHLVAGQRAHDQGTAAGVAVRLLGGDPPLVDKGLDEGVVLGDLRQFTVAEQVTAESPMCTSPSRLPANRIAVSVVPMPSSSGSASTCAAMAELPWRTALSSLLSRSPPGSSSSRWASAAITSWEATSPAACPAHTVGERQQPRTGVDRVFVVGAYQAAVAAGGVAEDQCHGRSSITVLPT